jgi:F0F1-type ATP synthase membrane subunit b/b'
MIRPDLSIIVVMLLVWGLYFLLKKSFFDPLNQILSERHAATEGAQQEAQQKLSQFDQKSRAYQQAIKSARLESYRHQENLRVEALKERFQVIAEGRRQAEQAISSGRTEIEGQVTAAKRTLESEVNSIADEIVKTVMR